jgi:hypothetical protein
MKRSAVISDDGLYRYRLERQWSDAPGTTTFVMLNPSTADAEVDDPTIRRCIGFAKRWGHGRLVVVNLFAYRATKPAELLDVDDPVGPENNLHLIKAAREESLIILGWGGAASRLYALHYMRVVDVLRMLAGPPTVSSTDGLALFCLGVTKKGQPRHPLMLSKNAGLLPYKTRRR